MRNTFFSAAVILTAFISTFSFATPNDICPLPDDPALLISTAWPLLDTNDSGLLELSEVLLLYPDLDLWMFNLIDSNNDGALSPQELRLILPYLPDDLLSYVDQNGNGILEYAEVSNYVTPQQFATIDKNNDGVIDCYDVMTDPEEGETNPCNPDIEPPVITLSNGDAILVECGDELIYPAAIATDNCDGDITSAITITGAVDTTLPGTYTIIYTVSDAAGNAITATCIITVLACPPEEGEPIAPCPLPPIHAEELIDVAWPLIDANGNTVIEYAEIVAFYPDMPEDWFNMADSNGNGALTKQEVLLLVTSSYFSIFLPSDLVTLADANGDRLIQFAEVDDYLSFEQFQLIDHNGNNVWDCEDWAWLLGLTPPDEGEPDPCNPDMEPPEIIMPGDPVIIVDCNMPPLLPGVIAIDNCDGDITDRIVVDGPIDMTIAGPYIYVLTVSDNAGNTVSATCTVIVDCPPQEGEPVEGEGEPVEELTVMLPGDVPLSLVLVPSGSFIMGCNEDEYGANTDESPQHEVHIPYDFYMGKYEVTQKQWVALMGSWPNNPPSSTYGIGDNCPAYFLSWYNMKDFIGALNTHLINTEQIPLVFRLPSEAEWEYACRAGTSTRFYWGEDEDYSEIGRYAWYLENSNGHTHPVGEKLPNAFGLYDITGNVWESCEDDYHVNYIGAPVDGSAWINSPRGTVRLDRGGAWMSEKINCRTADRGSTVATNNYRYVGFRLTANVVNNEGEGEPIEGEPSECNPDIIPPTITISAEQEVIVECGEIFIEPAAIAIDNCSGNLTAAIRVYSIVDPTVPGTYDINYAVSDAAGNAATATVEVIILPCPPQEGEPELPCPLPPISPEELLTVVWPLIDANGDNAVSYDEIVALYPQMPVEWFNMADRNGDGLLEIPELLSLPTILIGSMMYIPSDLVILVDANGDRLIQFEELDGYVAPDQFQFIDHNENGVWDCEDWEWLLTLLPPPVEGEPEVPCPLPPISPEELINVLWLLVNTNGDDVVTYNEILAIYPQMPLEWFNLADINGDGVLKLRELLSFTTILNMPIPDDLVVLVDDNGDRLIQIDELDGYVTHDQFLFIDHNHNGVWDCEDWEWLLTLLPPPIEGEPDSCNPDLEPPTIILPSDPIIIDCTMPTILPGVVAMDNCDGDLTNEIIISGPIDMPPNATGPHVYMLTVSDSAGNTVTATCVVIIDCPPLEGEPDLPCPLPPITPEDVVPALWPLVDSNGDGVLTMAEITALYPQFEPVWFQILDQNNNGVLEIHEVLGMNTILPVYDPIGNMMDLVPLIDANNDRLIQYVEVNNYATPEQFAFLDHNHNDVLDCEDWEWLHTLLPPPVEGEPGPCYPIIITLAGDNPVFLPDCSYYQESGFLSVTDQCGNIFEPQEVMITLTRNGVVIANVSTLYGPNGEIMIGTVEEVVNALLYNNTDPATDPDSTVPGDIIRELSVQYGFAEDTGIAVTAERIIIAECVPQEGEPILPCPLPPIHPEEIVPILWPWVDSNADGVVSFEEITALYPQMQPDWFAMLDQNNDGVLEMHELFYDVVIMEDGTITDPPIFSNDLVAMVDFNGDRLIQYEEMAAYLEPDQFHQIDHNDNGVWDCEDWGWLLSLSPPVEGEPEPCNPDLEPPVIIFIGDPMVIVHCGDDIVYPEVIALDNCDGDLAPVIEGPSNIDPTVPGTYTILYMASDATGNIAEAIATIVVVGCDPEEGEPILPCPLPPIHAQELVHLLWPWVDRNDDGVLVFEEIVLWYPQLTNELFAMVDQNQDGMIELHEVLVILGNDSELVRLLDADDNRLLEYPEIARYATPDQFHVMDRNHNDVLDCEDWEWLLSLTPPPPPPPPIEGEPEPCPLPAISGDELIHVLWRHFDRNGDGVLSFKEIKSKYPQIEREQFIDADTDGDHRLNINEVVSALALPEIADYILLLDENGDRLLQYREVADLLMRKQFRKLDYNKNKVLDCEDWEWLVTLPPPPPAEPDPHWLPVPEDTDGDFLADQEEILLDMPADVADRNNNRIPDGVDLARRLCRKLKSVEWIRVDGDPQFEMSLSSDAFEGQLPTDHIYVIRFDYMLDCVYDCPICEDYVTLGHLVVVNPVIHASWKDGMVIPLHAWHFMEHGSFSYFDGMCGPDYEKARIDPIALIVTLFPDRIPTDEIPENEGEISVEGETTPIAEGENDTPNPSTFEDILDSQDIVDIPAQTEEEDGKTQDSDTSGAEEPLVENTEDNRDDADAENDAAESEEGETEDTATGCNRSGKALEALKHFLRDYFLIGLASITLLGIHQGMNRP